MGARVKSRRQIRYLLSSNSPLSDEEKARLKRELHSGHIRVVKGAKRKRHD